MEKTQRNSVLIFYDSGHYTASCLFVLNILVIIIIIIMTIIILTVNTNAVLITEDYRKHGGHSYFL
jgi:hypothetical protein